MERTRTKYAEQTGHALPNLDPTSAEGRMLQAEIEAIQEVMGEAEPSNLHSRRSSQALLPAVFAYRVAARFTAKVGESAFVKLTAPAELIRHQPNFPDAWENEVIKEKFESPATAVEAGAHFNFVITPDGNTVWWIATDAGTVLSGLITRLRPLEDFEAQVRPGNNRVRPANLRRSHKASANPRVKTVAVTQSLPRSS